MSCSACCTVILSSDEVLKCTLEACGKLYLLLCTGGKKSTNSSSLWVCPECCSAAKKGGDNSLTPVGISKRTRDPNVTHRIKIPISRTEQVQKVDQSELFVDMRSLREEISALRDQLGTALSTIMSYEAKLEGYFIQVKALHNKIEETEVRCTRTRDLQIETTSQSTEPAESSAAASTTSVTRRQGLKKQSDKQNTQMNVAPATVKSAPDMTIAPTVVARPIASPKTAPLLNEETSPTLSKSHMIEKQWTEVKKKGRRPPSLCGTAGPSVTSLKAVEARAYIHLWNMVSSAEEVRSYLRELCPHGNCIVEEITPRGDYKSYKLNVPAAFSEKCMSTDIWPVNARIKTWIINRQWRAPVTSPQKNRSFRGPATA